MDHHPTRRDLSLFRRRGDRFRFCRVHDDRERDTKALLANIFSRVLYKTNFSNKKSNQILLSIDLLKDNKMIDDLPKEIQTFFEKLTY